MLQYNHSNVDLCLDNILHASFSSMKRVYMLRNVEDTQ